MEAWKKFFSILFGIILLITLTVVYFGMYDHGEISSSISYYSEEDWFYYTFTAFIIISGLVGLFLILRPIFTPSYKRYIIDKDKFGSIYISKSAIESNVRSCVNSHSEVLNSKANVNVVSGKDKKLKARVSCDIREAYDLKSLSERLVEDVKTSLENFTGYPVESVDVKLNDIKTDRDKKVV